MIWLLLAKIIIVLRYSGHCKIALGQTLDDIVSLGNLFPTKIQDSYIPENTI